MEDKMPKVIITYVFLFFLLSESQAQSGSKDIYWHIDPGVETCSMVIDPSLSQRQWHNFTKQVGAIASFKSLASASTLGKYNFRISVDYASTPVNQRDPAWINTFTHPDEDCPLGDNIVIPTIRGSIGITDDMDIGFYWTTAPEANYGALGGEFKYVMFQEYEEYPTAALRTSFSTLTGIPDFNLNVFSIELLASKRILILTPYIGVKQSLATSSETTAKVNLEQEIIPITQGYFGLIYSIWLLNLATEYNISNVNTFVISVGINF